MATKSLVSVDEYLRTSYEPDADFVDGEIVERNVGEDRHSDAQSNLVIFFGDLRKKAAGIRIRPEIRMKLAPRRFRVADLAVFLTETPAESVPSSPPLLVAEIVSPEDRHTNIIRRLDDYRAWGVRHIWLIDPYSRRLYIYGEEGLREVPSLSLPELQVEVSPSDVFSPVGEASRG